MMGCGLQDMLLNPNTPFHVLERFGKGILCSLGEKALQEVYISSLNGCQLW